MAQFGCDGRVRVCLPDLPGQSYASGLRSPRDSTLCLSTVRNLCWSWPARPAMPLWEPILALTSAPIRIYYAHKP